jgi:two-component system CheB/CheR fusion protein
MKNPMPAGSPALTEASPIRIVGLGASAGGLEALEQFIANVPPATGLAYVVVQHLDPTHKAMLTELLQRVDRDAGARSDRLDACRTGCGVRNPAQRGTHRGGRPAASGEPAQPRGRRLPIDVLFCSLARDQGERAIGVVLSGMGSDGTIGLQAIKAQAGLTLAQEPSSAQFDSMPRSAIDAGACDIVAPASELPQRILLIAAKRRPYRTQIRWYGGGQRAIAERNSRAVARAEQTRSHPVQESARLNDASSGAWGCTASIRSRPTNASYAKIPRNWICSSRSC